MQTNKVTLIGYIGNHLRTSTSCKGEKRAALRIATHTYQKNEKGKNITNTTWHDVVAWNKIAEYAERSFVIGSRVLVEGSLEYRTYHDHLGHKRYLTVIKAYSFLNLDR